MKRLIACMLAAFMLCGALAGCNDKKTGGGSIVDGIYVPEEELAIELWYTQGSDFTPGNEIKDNIVSKWVYDRSKIKITSIYGNDNGQWDTKLSRLVAGDNLPSIIACGAGQGPAHFAKLAENDLVWEITDEMLETYAPNYLRRVPKETLDMLRIDGKLYGLPCDQASNEQTNPEMDAETHKNVAEYIRGVSSDEHWQLWIRDDILKAIFPECKTWAELEKEAEKGVPVGDLTFDIPITTKEEYIDFMYKIKELNLKTENGKPVYAFGYSGGDNWEALNYIGGDMMGFSNQYYTSAWQDSTKEIVIPLVEDICYEAAKEQNRMIRDKVFDPESLIHTNDIFTEKVLAGQYAICAANLASGGIVMLNATLKEDGAGYGYRPFNVNIPNHPDYLPGKSTNKWSSALCFTKTNSEEDVIQLLNWINVTCSEEFEEIYWWGTEEDGLYTEKDGVRTYKDDRFNKRFIDGNKDALDAKDSKGIGLGSADVGAWYVTPVRLAQSMYAPQIYNKSFKLGVYSAIQKVGIDSEHAVTRDFPPSHVWASCYADIPEVIEFWGQREKWENAFKLAFTASSDKEFDKKWKEAKAILATVCDVDAMAKAMTKVAREEYKKVAPAK